MGDLLAILAILAQEAGQFGELGSGLLGNGLDRLAGFEFVGIEENCLESLQAFRGE